MDNGIRSVALSNRYPDFPIHGRTLHLFDALPITSSAFSSPRNVLFRSSEAKAMQYLGRQCDLEDFLKYKYL